MLNLSRLASASGAALLVTLGLVASVVKAAEPFPSTYALPPAAPVLIQAATVLTQHGVCAAMWADWWGFKMEAFDGIQENLPMVDYPEQSCAIVHSDSENGIQRLNQEAAKAMAHGERVGLHVPPECAIRWLTANPARSLGLDDRIGTLTAGKGADIVVWNRNPFSVYALAQQVYIDGVLRFDREHPNAKPRSDFLLGQPGAEGGP